MITSLLFSLLISVSPAQQAESKLLDPFLYTNPATWNSYFDNAKLEFSKQSLNSVHQFDIDKEVNQICVERGITDCREKNISLPLAREIYQKIKPRIMLLLNSSKSLPLIHLWFAWMDWQMNEPLNPIVEMDFKRYQALRLKSISSCDTEIMCFIYSGQRKEIEQLENEIGEYGYNTSVLRIREAVNIDPVFQSLDQQWLCFEWKAIQDIKDSL